MQTMIPVHISMPFQFPQFQQMQINQLPQVKQLPMSKRMKADESKPQKCKVAVKAKKQEKQQIGQIKPHIIVKQIGAIQNVSNIQPFCVQQIGFGPLQPVHIPYIANTPISQTISASSSPEPVTRKKVPVKPKNKTMLLSEYNLIRTGMKFITRTNINNRIDEWIKGTDQESELPYFWFL